MDVPKVLFVYGKRVDELDRNELIEALEIAATELEQYRSELMRQAPYVDRVAMLMHGGAAKGR